MAKVKSESSYQIRGFTGLNLQDDRTDTIHDNVLQETELTEAINVNVGNAGELYKRTGLTKIHSGVTLGVGFNTRILGYYYTDTVSQLIVQANTNVYYSMDGGTTFTVLGAYADAEFGIQYAGNFYIIRTGNVVVQWDGTTATNLAGSPSGTCAVIHKERMYILNTSAVGSLNSRVYFSSVGDPATWPGTNFFDVQPGDGDYLVSMTVLQDLLVIFKGKTTWALYVQGLITDWVLRNLNVEVGCVSKYSMKIIDGYLYFSTGKGIYRTDGTVFTDISKAISSVFKNRITSLSTVNEDSFGLWKDQLVCRVYLTPGGASTKKYYIYHYKTGSWTEWQFANAYAPQTFIDVKLTNSITGLYSGDAGASGAIYRYGGNSSQEQNYTDFGGPSGTNYFVSIKTKKFDFGLPLNMKRGKWIGLNAEGLDTWLSNVDDFSFTTGPITSGLSSIKSANNLTRLPGPGFFRTWQYQITGLNSNYIFVIGVTLQVSGHRTLIPT